jgi:hypothetical protein
MNGQGSGVRGQGPGEFVAPVCGLCDEWDYVGEDQERQIGTGLCKCIESPNFHLLMVASDEGCEFYLEADA